MSDTGDKEDKKEKKEKKDKHHHKGGSALRESTKIERTSSKSGLDKTKSPTSSSAHLGISMNPMPGSGSASPNGSPARRIKATTIGRSKNTAAEWMAAAANGFDDSLLPATAAKGGVPLHASLDLPKDLSSKVIDLSSKELTSVPVELFAYKEVEILTLKKNRLTSLPPEIGKLTSLQRFGISENMITELPPEISRLTKLEELDFRKNKLHRLVPEIGKLSSLKKLFLRNNQLSSLPPEIGDLEQLETLLLKSNHIIHLPDSIKKLKNLKVLDLYQNELRNLNRHVGKLTQLTEIDLNYNHLTSLPKLKHLKQLTKIQLSYNQFSEFPTALLDLVDLRFLDMEGNKLTTVPPEIGRLTTLEELSFMKNMLKSIPPEIGKLVKLKKLVLFQNELPDLPIEIKGCTAIEELDIRNNPLATESLRQGEWKKAIVHLTHLKHLKTGTTQAVPLKLVSKTDEDGSPSPKSPTGVPEKQRGHTISSSTAMKRSTKPSSTLFTLFNSQGGISPTPSPKPVPEGDPLDNIPETKPRLKKERSSNTPSISYHELLASLENPDLPTPATQPSPRHSSTSRSQKRTSDGPLIREYAVKTDTNEAGLRRAKKTVVQTAARGQNTGKPIFQNEDVSYAAYPFGDSKKAIFCVFDGHAGKEAAEDARDLLPKQLLAFLNEKEKLPTDMSEIFPLTFLKVDEQMSHREDVGTTATAALIWQVGSHKYLQVANVGDSRAYLCRESGVVRLTKDHKLGEEEEKARIINAGVKVSEGQTRINGLAVTRALGDRFAKEATEYGIIAVPYVSEVIELTPSDKYLIVATDGLWDIVSGQKAFEICQNETIAEAMAQQLVATAVQSTKCQDNVTVIVVVL